MCLCVYRLEGKHEDVCGSKQGYVCVFGLACCIIKHQQQRCGGQLQTDRIKQSCRGHGLYDPPDRYNMVASTPASTSVCLSLSLSLQQWYFCRFGHSNTTKGKIYQNISGCARWEESEPCIAEVLGHKWEMTQVCVGISHRHKSTHHSLCPLTMPNQADN